MVGKVVVEMCYRVLKSIGKMTALVQVFTLKDFAMGKANMSFCKEWQCPFTHNRRHKDLLVVRNLDFFSCTDI
jgi:hypothetical protein